VSLNESAATAVVEQKEEESPMAVQQDQPKCMEVNGQHMVIAYLAKHSKPHHCVCARCGAEDNAYDDYYYTDADNKRHPLSGGAYAVKTGKSQHQW
jgi:hypothetical protein